MRPIDICVTGSATAFSPWTLVDYLQNAFSIGLGFSISSGGALTATVHHTFDKVESDGARPVSVSQTTTVITVTDLGYQPLLNGINSQGSHQLSVGDSVQLINSDIPSGDGLYNVASVVSATQYTLTSAVSQSAVGGPNTSAVTARAYPHATLAAVAARADGNYAFPILGIKLILTAWTSGIACLAIRQGFGSR